MLVNCAPTVFRALEAVATSISSLFIILAALVLHILVFLGFLNLLVELPYKVLLHIKKFFGNLLLFLAETVDDREDVLDAFNLFANSLALLLYRLILMLFQNVRLQSLLFLQ